ncbi:MAG TPA: RluA family pseudouridine synthase [Thermodesulfovibrionales bacterium]|nr:RluA family pseudouridine synthase [Thermodesulfovibrionales bacterium]
MKNERRRQDVRVLFVSGAATAGVHGDRALMDTLRIRSASTVMDFLLGLGYTRTKVKQLLKHRAITVNGRTITRPDHRLSINDSILLDAKPKAGAEILDAADIKIVHEDDAVIVIEKPSGLLTIATEKEKKETAYYILNAYFKERSPSRPDRVFIVHRLDRETSGLIVFAKDEAAKHRLQKDWNNAEKKYYAVVEGIPADHEGRIESYLSETASFRVYSEKAGEESKHAVTRYRVMKSGKGFTLLDVVLETGKKHQIRVHLSDVGCPVAGDRKYGAKTNPIRRIALHAYSLSFAHPATGRRMHFTARLPKSFNALVEAPR